MDGVAFRPSIFHQERPCRKPVHRGRGVTLSLGVLVSSAPSCLALGHRLCSGREGAQCPDAAHAMSAGVGPQHLAGEGG